MSRSCPERLFVSRDWTPSTLATSDTVSTMQEKQGPSCVPPAFLQLCHRSKKRAFGLSLQVPNDRITLFHGDVKNVDH